MSVFDIPRFRPLIPDPCSRLKKSRLTWNTFPGSVGAQVLFSGCIAVLFADRKAINDCWKKGMPDEIGELRAGYRTRQLETMADVVESGHAVNTNPGGHS